MIDIYPTKAEVLVYEIPPELEGNSLVSQLEDLNASWRNKAIVTQFLNHSILCKNYNYIHYSNDSEELYNHSSNPNELTNVASMPKN